MFAVRGCPACADPACPANTVEAATSATPSAGVVAAAAGLVGRAVGSWRQRVFLVRLTLSMDDASERDRLAFRRRIALANHEAMHRDTVPGESMAGRMETLSRWDFLRWMVQKGRIRP